MLIVPVSPSERTLINALRAALKWSYRDTLKHLRDEKVGDGNWDAQYLQDLADMQRGVKLARSLRIDVLHPKEPE